MNYIIPALIEKDSAQGRKIIKKVVGAIERANKRDLHLISTQEKKIIERILPDLQEELEELKYNDSCKFNGYKLIKEDVRYVLFQLAQKQYRESSSFEWAGDFYDVYIDSLALLTQEEQPNVFGIIPFIGSYNNFGNELLSESARYRIKTARERADKLERNDRIQIPQCEGYTYLSDYTSFIFNDLENKLEKAENRAKQKAERREKAIERARTLLRKI